MLKSNTQVSLTTILSLVTEEDLWRKYCPEWKGNLFNSPLRVDDLPSFSIKYHESKGKYMFKDFATGDSGDIIKFVRLRFGINYQEALNKIYKELGVKIDRRTLKRAIQNSVYTTSSKISIDVKTRKWDTRDIEFWNSFGINKSVLDLYQVYPLKYFLVSKKINYCKGLTYGFLECKDGEYSWKIYQPFDRFKWINNSSFDVIQGWSQLPDNGEILIITKSRKDIMAIVSTTDYCSCAPQSENTPIKPHILNQLKSRFQDIFILYDNDSPGIKSSNKICERGQLKQIFIPTEKYKDYSDLIKGVGVGYASKILKKLINKNK